MKNKGTIFLAICFSLLITLAATAGQAWAGMLCSDFEGLPVPCKDQTATRLDLTQGCSDFEGLPVPCESERKTRIDLVEACTDFEGLPVPCREWLHNSQAPENSTLTADNILQPDHS